MAQLDWWACRLDELEDRCASLKQELATRSRATGAALESAHSNSVAAKAIEAEADTERRLAAKLDAELQQELAAMEHAQQASVAHATAKAQLLQEIEAAKNCLSYENAESRALAVQAANTTAIVLDGSLPRHAKELQKSLCRLEDNEAQLEEEVEQEKNRRQQARAEMRTWLAQMESQSKEIQRRIDEHPEVVASLEAEQRSLRQQAHEAEEESIVFEQQTERCLKDVVPRYEAERELYLNKIRELTVADEAMRARLREVKDRLFDRQVRAEDRQRCAAAQRK